MKKLKTVIVTLLLAMGMVGCGNNIAGKAIEQGKLAMANKEYDKALGSFQLAIDEGSKDDEVQKMLQIIEKYNKAKNIFDEGKVEAAKEIIDGIDEDYKNYSIKDDIEGLKKKIEQGVKEEKETNDKISQINDLVESKSYNEAKLLVEEIESNTLTEEQQVKIDELNKKITLGIEQLEADKKVKEEKEKQTLTKQKAISYVVNIYGVAEDRCEYRVPFEMKNDGQNYYEVYYDYVGSSIPATYYEYKVYEDGRVIRTLDNLS